MLWLKLRGVWPCAFVYIEKRVVLGVCDLWPVAEPRKNKRKGARSVISR